MTQARWLRGGALLTYAAFLVYQSLGSGAPWDCDGRLLSFEARVSRADLLANVVAYVPLGLLGVVAASAGTTRRGRIVAYAVAVWLAIGVFSTTMEAVQSCQAGRVSSVVDVCSNTAGGLLGVLIGLLVESVALAKDRQAEVLVVPTTEERGLRRLRLLTAAVAVVWVASQTLPWTFSGDVGVVRANLSFLRRWQGVAALDGWRLLGHAAAWTALAGAVYLIAWRRAHVIAGILAVSAVSVGLQALVSTRGPLSFEELAGMAVALVLTMPLLVLEDDSGRGEVAATVLFVAGLLTVLAYQLRPEPGMPRLSTFHWWPGVGIGGMRGALDYAMLFGWCGLSTVVAAGWSRRPRRLLTWPLIAVVLMLILEVAQRFVPGRTGDLSAPTFTLFGVLAARACLGDLYASRGRHPA